LEGPRAGPFPARSFERSILQLQRTPALVLASQRALEDVGLASGLTERRDEHRGSEDAASEPLNGTVRRSRLLSLRASAVLGPTEAHVLHGYTPTYGQYWQDESASEAPVRSTLVEMPPSGELFQAAQAFAPVGFVLRMLCEEGRGEFDADGGRRGSEAGEGALGGGTGEVGDGRSLVGGSDPPRPWSPPSPPPGARVAPRRVWSFAPVAQPRAG
jgi:hypothetical protein